MAMTNEVAKQPSKRYPIPFDIHGPLIKMGWEFIDDIVWEKLEISVKNRNAGFLRPRKPLAYKPNAVTEYVMVYRKNTDKLIDWNIRQYDRKTVNESKVEDGCEFFFLTEKEPEYFNYMETLLAKLSRFEETTIRSDFLTFKQFSERATK